MTSEARQTSETRETVLHVITGLNDGGAEAVLFGLVRCAQDYEHKIISLMGPGKYGSLLEEAGFEVSYLNLSPSMPSPLKIMQLFGMVRRARADIVQTWMYHADLLGGLAARAAGVRRVIWGLHHTTLDKRGTKRSTRVLVGINARVSNRLPAKIITCSKMGGDVHRDIGYPASKIVVVHNGYNTSAFKPDPDGRAAIREEFSIADDQLLLGCVARYNPQKDHENLILGFAQVLKTYPKAHLLLVGPGLTNEQTAVTGLLAAKGIADNVTLAGPRPDIPAVMNALDLHVLGSAFGEAFPNVLSEAMSCGTPCVATDVGDSATIVGDTGKIVAPKDPAALARAIIEMAPTLREEAVASACRQRIVDNFTLEHMTTGYVGVWKETGSNSEKGSASAC